LEQMLFGGSVSVVRKNSDYEEGEMDKIRELVLEYQGQYRILTIDHCRAFFASIKTNDIKTLQFGSLKPYVQKEGFSRFRHYDIFEEDLKPMDLSLPVGMSLSRGLGLRIDTDDEHVLS